MIRQPSNLSRFSPLLLVMLLIFGISHFPGDEIVEVAIPHFDKICHVGLYTILGWAAIRAALPWQHKTAKATFNLGIVVFCLLYGISDEFHQSFVPFRTPSIADLVADTIGGILAVLTNSYTAINVLLKQPVTKAN